MPRKHSTKSTLQKPFLVKDPEPPAELVEEILESLMDGDIAQFAGHIETARSLWRNFRELVEAPEFPAHLAPALIKEFGHEPDCGGGYFEEVLDPGYRESLLPIAREFARKQMGLSTFSSTDVATLGGMGITL